MRRSKTITLTTLGAAALAAGCGREPARSTAPARPADTSAFSTGGAIPANAVDFTWYRADGVEIPEQWTFDHKGKLAPLLHPHDQEGRPWVWDADGDLFPLAAALPTSTASPSQAAHGPAGRTTGTGHSTTTTYHRSPMIVPIFLGSMAMGGRSGGPAGVSRPSAGMPSRPAGATGGFGGTGGAIGGSGGSGGS